MAISKNTLAFAKKCAETLKDSGSIEKDVKIVRELLKQDAAEQFSKVAGIGSGNCIRASNDDAQTSA